VSESVRLLSLYFFALACGLLIYLFREANTTLQIKTGHPQLRLEGGSVCPKSELQASTAIQFVCDTSVFAAGTHTNTFLPLSTHASPIFSCLRQTRINSAVTRRRGHRMFVLHRMAHTCECPASLLTHHSFLSSTRSLHVPTANAASGPPSS
jgi:hypothetical protein